MADRPDANTRSATPTERAGRGAAENAAGLSAAALRLHGQVAEALQQGRFEDAELRLNALLALAPTHPEVLRLHAALLCKVRRYAEALPVLARALAQRPADPRLLTLLGGALRETGDAEGSLDAFRRCVEHAPASAANWFNLGLALDRQERLAEAGEAMRQALERDPTHVPATVGLARILQFLGRIDEARVHYRRALELAPQSAQVWFGLSTLRTAAFDAADVDAMQRLYAHAELGEDERIALGFALAKGFEDQDRYVEAFATLSAANAAKRRRLRWDATEFSRYVDAVVAAFEASAAVRASDAALGDDVVFVVGMPRSGSTLVERILAAHPEVTGANEPADLPAVVAEESRRRGRPFPAWVGQAGADDWQRLGRRYLERVAGRRAGRRVLVEKALQNWSHVGAAAAMLPGARFVDCRRDPVETCLACFRQLFAREHAYAYDLTELAAYWRDYDRTMQAWQRLHPRRVHVLAHERLLADADGEIRALLDFGGLGFDDACLRFHEAER
ncbi:MAG TPA: sulfotransferase, partial [Dokdonella sp.]